MLSSLGGQIQAKEDLVTTTNIVMTSQLLLIMSFNIEMQPVFQHLHNTHAGRGRMISISRAIYWWPGRAGRDQDMTNYVRNCSKYGQKSNHHPTHSFWPITYQPLQRVHMDYCGPLLQEYYALIIIDTFSKYPEIFITKISTADFTRTAIKKYMLRK